MTAAFAILPWNHLPLSKLVPFLLVLKQFPNPVPLKVCGTGSGTPKTQLLFLNRFFFLFYHFFEAFCQGIPRAILAEEYESLAPGQVLMGQDNIGDKDPHPSACIAEETKPALHACQSAWFQNADSWALILSLAHSLSLF